MLRCFLVSFVFVGLFSEGALAQPSSKDEKKIAKRAAHCEAIFHRLKFRKLALSKEVDKTELVDANWKFWSGRALKVTPKDKYSKYQKKARKRVIKQGASSEVVSGCVKERSSILVQGLQDSIFGGPDVSKALAEAASRQQAEKAKPENVVFCKMMADRLLSYHSKNAAEFEKEPSKLIVADAKRANDSYDALPVEQRAKLEAEAAARVNRTYSDGALKASTDMCMPGFFMKSSRVVSVMDMAKKRQADREASK